MLQEQMTGLFFKEGGS